MNDTKLILLAIVQLLGNPTALAQSPLFETINKDQHVQCIKPSVVSISVYNKENEVLSNNESGVFGNHQGEVITTMFPAIFYGAARAEVTTSDNTTYPIKRVVAFDKYVGLIKLSVDIGNDLVQPALLSSTLPKSDEVIVQVAPRILIKVRMASSSSMLSSLMCEARA